MADKQASVYIVDVGASMGEKNYGREQTDLEMAMGWLWDRVTSTVSVASWNWTAEKEDTRYELGALVLTCAGGGLT